MTGQAPREKKGNDRKPKELEKEIELELTAAIEFDVRNASDQPAAFRESFAQVDAAEESGFHSIWLAERHFQPQRSVLSSPIVVAGAIADRTERVRIGIAVQVLPLNHPIRIAEEAATVDQISQGRFNFGIGRSGLTISYSGYNIPYSESRGRFWESLEVIIKAWTTDEFSYEGEFYNFHNVRLMPKPYQKPHPPIRMAAASPESFARAGSMAIPIFVNVGFGTFNDLKARIAEYCNAWEQAGNPGEPDVGVRVPVYTSNNSEKARSEPKDSMLAFYQRQANLMISRLGDEGIADPEGVRRRAEHLSQLTYDEILDSRVVFGAPDEITEQLGQLKRELGLSMVVADVNAGGRVPPDLVLDSIKLLGQEVAPNLV